MSTKAIDVFRANAATAMRFRGLTITELAAAAEVDRPNMSRILAGKEKVTIERAERIANALEIHLSDLLSENFKVERIHA